MRRKSRGNEWSQMGFVLQSQKRAQVYLALLWNSSRVLSPFIWTKGERSAGVNEIQRWHLKRASAQTGIEKEMRPIEFSIDLLCLDVLHEIYSTTFNAFTNVIKQQFAPPILFRDYLTRLSNNRFLTYPS